MAKLGNLYVKWRYEGDTTQCIISKDNEDVVKGQTTKYATDKPDKRLGRKIAFERAMKMAAFKNRIPKSERKLAWEDFRKNINQPL